MAAPSGLDHSIESRHQTFFVGLIRAAGGAIVFSFPMLMTMEMWSLGYTIPAYKMAIFLVLSIPLLAGLAYYSGFENPVGVVGSVVDAFVAYVVGFVTVAIMLSVFLVLDPAEMSLTELIGKVTLQAMPAGLGAVLAASQLGSPNHAETDEQASKSQEQGPPDYWRELFLMIAGALFLAFNVAPTEEVMLIAFMMTVAHAAALLLISVAIMHAFVYVVKFKGQERIPAEQSHWQVFFRFTVVGYALALIVSFYCLWIFGRTEETALDEVLMTTVVLGFPASLGAAAARLIL
ncbi:MAG: TIGR02587 family membrane protein [Planctomycetaceae bacterium]